MKGFYYIYPKEALDTASIETALNNAFDKIFSINGKHLVSKNVDVTESSLLELRKAAKENKCDIIVSWISDDIGEMGFDLYSQENSDQISFSRSLSSSKMSLSKFLLLCEKDDLLERELK